MRAGYATPHHLEPTGGFTVSDRQLVIISAEIQAESGVRLEAEIIELLGMRSMR